eukprot:gene7849-7279_t
MRANVFLTEVHLPKAEVALEVARPASPPAASVQQPVPVAPAAPPAPPSPVWPARFEFPIPPSSQPPSQPSSQPRASARYVPSRLRAQLPSLPRSTRSDIGSRAFPGTVLGPLHSANLPLPIP